MILYSKKIVDYFSMIFTFTEDDLGLDSIFHNKNLNIYDWESKIPSPEMGKNLFGDPALMQEFYGEASEKLSYIGSLYLHNQIRSTRIAIGKIAHTLGFLQTDFNNISNIFKEETDNITIAIKTADAIINSEYFARGMDAIGAIPVVGWIIKIIVKAAELIYKIVKKINDKKIENVRKELAGQFAIPLVKFDEEIDEALTRTAMFKIAQNNLDYIFSPRYIFEDFSDFETVQEKVNPQVDQLVKFYNIRSKNVDGLGFIPGTINIAGALRFPTGGAQEIYDTGDLYPTVRSLCTSVNQIVQKPGPSLFGLNVDKVMSKWESNIYMLLSYADESIKKGWTMYETGIVDTNQWKCAEPLLGMYGKKACKKPSQVGKKYDTFSTGHYGAFRSYLIKRYFGNKFPTKSGKILPLNADDVIIEKSIPVQALKTIKETQKAIIDSEICMYINLETKGATPLFSGLYSNSSLRKTWKENVKLVLNSDEWKKVRFLDVPEGDVKDALWQKATSKGYDPEKLGPISKTIDTIGTQSVLKNPKPPSPFNPVNVEHLTLPNGKKTSAGTGSIAVAAVALGILGLAAKRRK